MYSILLLLQLYEILKRAESKRKNNIKCKSNKIPKNIVFLYYY